MKQLVDRGDYEVFFTAHALIQAARRGIDWASIEGAIRAGTFKRLKNDRINIEKPSPQGAIVCVGIEFQPHRIKVITIERKRGKMST
ncbi:hypothetical protein AUJ14_02455 [Candidatus Micrarchaeota archaeon CG1_02_55_22]|nr:MAG: hypothetical protein AUJ14_02455 [Candidatus Micrarchaeota archaeon CG1_02_55_22]